jgi:hypothetical protein
VCIAICGLCEVFAHEHGQTDDRARQAGAADARAVGSEDHVFARVGAKNSQLGFSTEAIGDHQNRDDLPTRYRRRACNSSSDHLIAQLRSSRIVGIVCEG